MPVGQGMDRVAHVFQHMPAVSHLNRFRRTLAGAIRISTRPVARDDLYAGMLAQPVPCPDPRRLSRGPERRTAAAEQAMRLRGALDLSTALVGQYGL